VLEERFVDGELDHLRVHEHEFEFGWVLLIEQRGEDSVETYGFTLTSGTCYE
jgi:hypothetical protein